jgi:hypothetical protein
MNTVSSANPSDNGRPSPDPQASTPGRLPPDLLNDSPNPADLEGILDAYDTDEGDPLSIEAVKSDTVGLGRPSPRDWVRTHPDPSHCRPLTLLEGSKRKWTFWGVAADLLDLPELEGELKTFTAITSVTNAGDLFLWVLRRGGGLGDENPWVESAKDAARRARSRWVRLRAGDNKYKVTVAAGDLGVPDFRGWPFEEVVSRALKGRLITSADHAVLKNLRGEVEGAAHEP